VRDVTEQAGISSRGSVVSIGVRLVFDTIGGDGVTREWRERHVRVEYEAMMRKRAQIVSLNELWLSNQ
jgi:hypothetical protein